MADSIYRSRGRLNLSRKGVEPYDLIFKLQNINWNINLREMIGNGHGTVAKCGLQVPQFGTQQFTGSVRQPDTRDQNVTTPRPCFSKDAKRRRPAYDATLAD